MLFNASLLKTWMTCPLQAKFQYEDQLPRLQNAKASFGTCMHKALEHYNDGESVQNAIAKFQDYWKNPKKLGVEPDYWPTGNSNTYAGLRQRGEEMLLNYDEQMKWVSREVIASEHKFKVPFGDHELSGIVDLLEFRRAGNGKKQLRVIDYKTNSRQPTFANLRYDIQFTVYVYASMQPEFWTGVEGTKYLPIDGGEELYEEFQDVARRAIWYHLWTNKDIDAGPRDDGDFERLYRLCEQIQIATETGAYIPTISADSCQYCSYTEQCRYVIPVLRQMEQEEEENED